MVLPVAGERKDKCKTVVYQQLLLTENVEKLIAKAAAERVLTFTK